MNKIPYDEKTLDIKIKKIIESLIGKNKDYSNTISTEHINRKFTNKYDKFRVFIRKQDNLDSNFELNLLKNDLKFNNSIPSMHYSQINCYCNLNSFYKRFY